MIPLNIVFLSSVLYYESNDAPIFFQENKGIIRWKSRFLFESNCMWTVWSYKI